MASKAAQRAIAGSRDVVRGAGRVRAENGKPGTVSWLPRRLRHTPGTKRAQTLGIGHDRWLDSGRCRLIEGWCSQASVRAGDSLAIFVSTDPPAGFTLDVYRMGYYAGLGARHMLSVGPLPGTTQPDPLPGPMRIVECEWTRSAEIAVPPGWLSGVYLGKLTRTDDGTENYVIFIVRDGRPADIIVQCSDLTWQAYNRWPDAYSLYSDGEELSGYYGTDVVASFDRPYLSSDFTPLVPSTGKYFVFEFPFHYWLEGMGYDVTYLSSLDTHRALDTLLRGKAFLSIGHDEYWTLDMFNHVAAAVQGGVSTGFFSGNSCCFEIDLRASGDGRAQRVLSRKDRFGLPGYETAEDEGARAFHDAYPFPNQAPDEGTLIGGRNRWPAEGCGDWVCSAPEHWVFAGTGMREGDAIPNLIGHEWNGSPAAIEGLKVVSTGPTHDELFGAGQYAATIYTGPHENVIFNAATVWWSSGLATPPGFQRPMWQGMPAATPDSRVQQITANILARMIRSSPEPSRQPS
jgi:hypothetical protein